MTPVPRSSGGPRCRRPFVAVVSFYGLGLLIAEHFAPPPAALFAVSFFILSLSLALARCRPILLCALLVFAGWTNLILHTAVISPFDLRRLLGDKSEQVTVHGELARTPQIRISEHHDGEMPRFQAQLRVSQIRAGDQPWHQADGTIIVFTPGLPEADFLGGQAVEVSGTIARPPPALAQGLFDERNYLQTRGIFYELRTRSVRDWQLRQPVLHELPLTDRFLAWSGRVLALGLPQDQTQRLLWAMTLGWRTAFTGDVGAPFLEAGTMHLFAIDGLRIGLISGILVALLRVLQVSRGWCGAIAIPVIWFYTAATGWESSAVRASLMMTIVLGGWALKRPVDLLNSLAGAAFLILLWDPQQLFQASFQLSFFVMLAIAILLPRLNELSNGLMKPDPLIPAGLIPKWRRTLAKTVRLLARYFSLSLAAWIGSIPLSALYFHLFSPVSTLANVIAVPLGTFALMANIGALVCGAWLPFAVVLFNNAAWFLMLEMERVSQWSTKIPGAYAYVCSPSWIWIGIYYAFLILLPSPAINTTRRKILGAAGAVFIAALYFASLIHWRAETDLTVLPLNGGHAVFVNGTKNNCLIDCGSRDAVNFTVKPFLQAQGVHRLSWLILTEGDSKNCGGARTLESDFDVGKLWTSSARFRSRLYNQIVASFNTPASHRNILHSGQSAGPWRVLWPDDSDDLKRADDHALVLLGNFYGRKVLLLSDLSPYAQKRLLSETNDLRADIVIAGLPNQGEPLCDALADAIQPRLIVIADSQYPSMRRANPGLRERLAERDVPVVYTSDSGAVTIDLKKGGWKWKTAWQAGAE